MVVIFNAFCFSFNYEESTVVNITKESYLDYFVVQMDI